MREDGRQPRGVSRRSQNDGNEDEAEGTEQDQFGKVRERQVGGFLVEYGK